jgi:hypothetical protein
MSHCGEILKCEKAKKYEQKVIGEKKIRKT